MTDTVKYYDIHTTALAYINRPRRIVPEHGGDAYYAATLACLRGKADQDGKVQKTWVDVNLAGETAKRRFQFVLDYLEANGIEADRAGILATVKFGDLRPEPFIYSKGEKAGQHGYSLKARLLKLDHVTVNGVSIDFGDDGDQQQGSAQAGSPEQSAPPAASTDHAGHAEQRQATEADPWMGGPLPDQVKLNKNDPDFQRKKDQLKQEGYRWNSKEQLWYRPEAIAA